MTNDVETLPQLKPWNVITRGRFSTTHRGSEYVVDVDFFDFDERIRLYRDGELVDMNKSKANFDLGDGARIEAAVAMYGMKHVRLQSEDAPEPVTLQPVEGTAEGWRAKFHREHPGWSNLIGKISLVIVILAVIIDVPPIINRIAEQLPRIGVPEFEIPTVPVSGTVMVAIGILGILAALERGISMKHNPWIDD